MTNSITTEIIGYIGGGLLMICTAPQVLTMWRNRSAKDVSLAYSILYFLGLAFTLAYMVLLNATAGIITISIETILAIIVMFSKVYLDRLEGPETRNLKQDENDAFE